MLKKAASGVLAVLPCSRTQRTLRASKRLRPCWTDFFEHSLAFWCRCLRGRLFASRCELFNSPNYAERARCESGWAGGMTSKAGRRCLSSSTGRERQTPDERVDLFEIVRGIELKIIWIADGFELGFPCSLGIGDGDRLLGRRGRRRKWWGLPFFDCFGSR